MELNAGYIVVGLTDIISIHVKERCWYWSIHKKKRTLDCCFMQEMPAEHGATSVVIRSPDTDVAIIGYPLASQFPYTIIF